MRTKRRKAVRNLNCPRCFSRRTVLRGFRYNHGMIGRCLQTPSFQNRKQLFLCKSCGRKFTQDDGYLRMRFSPETIRGAVSFYGKGFSSAEVRTRLERKGIRVSRWTIIKWVNRFGR
jgi:transposase-like protein